MGLRNKNVELVIRNSSDDIHSNEFVNMPACSNTTQKDNTMRSVTICLMRYLFFEQIFFLLLNKVKWKIYFFAYLFYGLHLQLLVNLPTPLWELNFLRCLPAATATQAALKDQIAPPFPIRGPVWNRHLFFWHSFCVGFCDFPRCFASFFFCCDDEFQEFLMMSLLGCHGMKTEKTYFFTLLNAVKNFVVWHLRRPGFCLFLQPWISHCYTY